jgi:MFS family permease
MGTAIAPYMITVFTLAAKRTPASRTGAVMTVLAGVTGLGYAIGASIAGRLTDAVDYGAAFAVPVVAGIVATVIAVLAAPVLRTEQHRAGEPSDEAGRRREAQVPAAPQQRSASSA